MKLKSRVGGIVFQAGLEMNKPHRSKVPVTMLMVDGEAIAVDDEILLYLEIAGENESELVALEAAGYNLQPENTP